MISSKKCISKLLLLKNKFIDKNTSQSILKVATKETAFSFETVRFLIK